jgi:hypothetical protein
VIDRVTTLACLGNEDLCFGLCLARISDRTLIELVSTYQPTI